VGALVHLSLCIILGYIIVYLYRLIEVIIVYCIIYKILILYYIRYIELVEEISDIVDDGVRVLVYGECSEHISLTQLSQFFSAKQPDSTARKGNIYYILYLRCYIYIIYYTSGVIYISYTIPQVLYIFIYYTSDVIYIIYYTSG